MGRKKSRENAFKCVFQLEFENSYNILKMIDSLEVDVNDEDKQYIIDFFEGIRDKKEEIDKIILSNLKGWNIDRIAKVDLAILRLAIYEIKYKEDTPYKVSVNEAVELAKAYGDDKSPSFVNGLLAKVS